MELWYPSFVNKSFVMKVLKGRDGRKREGTMPKEIVRSCDGPYIPKVGWSPTGYVQLGVEAQGERSLFWMLLGSQEKLTKLGQEVLKMGELGYEDDDQRARHLLNTLDTVSDGGYQGIWADLDRQACNELIRLLRRARDSAYGRDE